MNIYVYNKFIFLLGIYENKTLINKLLGNDLVIYCIFNILDKYEYLKHINYNECIIINNKSEYIYYINDNHPFILNIHSIPQFPKPKGINIKNFMIKNIIDLPKEFEHYKGILYSCPKIYVKEDKNIYITIKERYVNLNKLNYNLKINKYNDNKIIYLMISVPNFYKIYNYNIINKENIINNQNLNCIKKFLDKYIILKSNELIEINNNTPYKIMKQTNLKSLFIQSIKIKIS